MTAEPVDVPAGPRTRSERTADSRLLILDAAVACLVEDGYAGASTLAVQARAGVSRGRLLHHFPSRAELLVAAAEHLSTTLLAEVQQRAEALMADQPTGRERVDRAIDLMWATFQEPPFWAAMELWTAARTDPDLRAGLRTEERRLRASIRAVADGIWGPEIAAAPLYAELCELLFTSMRGVALVYAFEDRPGRDRPAPRALEAARRPDARPRHALTDPAAIVRLIKAPRQSGLTAPDAAASMTQVHVRARRGDPMSVPIPALQGRGMTMSDQLARHARKTPDAVALRFDGAGRSYAELDERVTRLARALAERGVGHGRPDRRAGAQRHGGVGGRTSPACGSGAIVVPVNFRLVADEVAYVLTDSGATALVVDAPMAELAAKAREQAPDVRDGAGDRRGVRRTDSEDFEAAVAAASDEPLDVVVDEDEPAFIMYTSGTTGRPKGAVLTHHNLLMHVFSQVTHLGWHPEDRVAAPGAPLFHIAGVAGGLPPLLVGGTNVIMKSGGFDPVATLDMIEQERVSSIFLVPAMWAAVVAVPGIADRDLSHLRRISWGAAPASTTLLRTLIDTFPQAEVVTAFGQTECSPVTCFLRGEDSVRKIGSVGTPMLNVEVRVVDEAMNDVPQGEVGEIVYRSPMVMKEYWGKPDETSIAFEGGWFHSGDLVRQDEEGYFYVVDRKKDMIITGGENMYCAEVENVLAAHPKVARGRADRRPRREVRRGAARGGRAAGRRRPADRRGAGCLVPGEAGALQEPARVLRRRRAPPQPQRQGAQDGAAPGALRRLAGRLARRLIATCVP